MDPYLVRCVAFRSKGKISASGIEMVRRDNTVFCKQTMEAFVTQLLQKNDLPQAINVVKHAVSDLINGNVSYQLLTQSRKLSKMTYKTKVPHITVLNKIRARCPAEAPKLGDRVDFVILAGAPGEKASTRAEDPKYAEDHNLPLDVKEYVRTQLKGPLSRILDVVIGKKETAALFNIQNYIRSDDRSGGALLAEHGFTSSLEKRVIKPNVTNPRKKAKKEDTRKITSFFQMKL